MFEQPKCIQNSFSVIFSRVLDIRKKAFEFEDKLKREYGQPQIISVPDELDPQIPRIIFDSISGYSQIFISQVSMSLNVTYSTDFQTDSSKRLNYLYNRAPIVFRLINALEKADLHFTGLTTLIHVPSTEDEQAILSFLADEFLKEQYTDNTYDIEVKKTSIIDDQFFSNITIDNYRSWSVDSLSTDVIKLVRNTAVQKGVRVIGDFNDRYSFNENLDYHTTKDLARTIIDRGYMEVDNIITRIKER